MAISEMCSAENIMSSKLMLSSIKLPEKSKQEPLLKESYIVEPIKPTKGSSLKQILVALSANWGTINTGLVFGYTAVSLPQLTSTASRIVVSSSQASWIASVSTIGTPCGCILAGYLTDLLGRKRTLIALQLPAIIGWTMVGSATSVQWIYVGRFLAGLSSGMIGAPSRVYTAEVSQPHLRGVLAAFASVGTSLGVMTEYVFGAVLDWDTLAYINALVPIIALFLAFLIPESPSWLISSKKDETRCRASLKRVRDSVCDVDVEVNDLIMFSKSTESTSFKEKLRVISQPSTYKPFFILSTYFLLSQFSGLNIVTFFAVDVIKDSGSTIDKYVATIVLGVIRLVFTVIGCMLMRRMGRKPLSYVSSIGGGMSMMCFAAYMYQNVYWTETRTSPVATWFPILCLFVFYACATIGYLIVPWVMIGELFPRQIRGMVGGVTTCIGHFSIFVVLQLYPHFQEWFTKPGTFTVYGIVSLMNTFFFYYCCPETKGKTLQEIEESFEKRKTKKLLPTLQVKPPAAAAAAVVANVAVNDEKKPAAAAATAAAAAASKNNGVNNINNNVNNNNNNNNNNNVNHNNGKKKLAFPNIVYSTPKNASNAAV